VEFSQTECNPERWLTSLGRNPEVGERLTPDVETRKGGAKLRKCEGKEWARKGGRAKGGVGCDVRVRKGGMGRGESIPTPRHIYIPTDWRTASEQLDSIKTQAPSSDLYKCFCRYRRLNPTEPVTTRRVLMSIPHPLHIFA